MNFSNDAIYTDSLPMTDKQLDDARNELQSLFDAADAIMANPIYADTSMPATQDDVEA